MSSDLSIRNSITELPPYYAPPQEEGLINRTLPLEIFLRIFSFLSHIDHQSTVRVCKDWHRVTIGAAGDYWAGSLLAFLKHNLDGKKYSFQKEWFEKELTSFRGRKFQNIPEIRKWSFKKESLWINLIKSLDFNDLNKPPLSKNRICFIARIYKVIDSKESILDENRRSSALYQIAKKKIHLGEVALEAARRIPNENLKANAFTDIAKDLIAKGQFEKALEVVSLIPSSYSVFPTLLIEIVKGWIKKKKFDQALKAIKLAVNKLLTEQWSEGRLKIGIKIGSLDLFNIVNFIPEEHHSEVSILICDIAKGLEAQGNLKKAAKAAIRIPDKVQQKHAVESIVQKAVVEGGFEKSKEIANSMPNKATKMFILEAISKEQKRGEKRRKLNSGAVERH